jgi:DNA-binding MarR family transcriptional regulator
MEHKTNCEESYMPLGRQLAVLARLYYGALAASLKDLEIDRYYSVLLLLDQFPAEFTQQMLGDRLQIDKTTMVRVMDYLAEREYIRREAKPEDRRCHRIVLTEKGKAIVPEIKKATEALNQEMLAGLNPQDSHRFKDMLDQIYHNLQHLPSEEVLIEYATKRTSVPN